VLSKFNVLCNKEIKPNTRQLLRFFFSLYNPSSLTNIRCVVEMSKMESKFPHDQPKLISAESTCQFKFQKLEISKEINPHPSPPSCVLYARNFYIQFHFLHPVSLFMILFHHSAAQIKGAQRRKNRLIESNEKYRYLTKIDLERDCAAGVYLSEAPSPPRFLFGVVKQICRF
jgi:hypothetical protein